VATESLRSGAFAPKRRVQLTPYLLLLPAFIVLGAIIFYPLVRAILLSFQTYNLESLGDNRFVGLDNYVQLFTQDTVFWQAVLLSVQWVVANVIIQLLIGGAFALVLNEDFPGRALVRGLILVPWVMSSAVTGLMWTFMFDSQFGIFDKSLVALHLI
jgi:multiple sugar transport system permease protein